MREAEGGDIRRWGKVRREYKEIEEENVFSFNYLCIYNMGDKCLIFYYLCIYYTEK